MPMLSQQAIALGVRGYYVAPLQPRAKAPLTQHGIRDSVNTTRQIWEFWHTYPDANIAIDLQRSGLLGIGPDSPAWLARFQEWGLPDTMVARSGGGEGHLHYYYRRPEGCPIFRINRPGEYDIQTDGYFVAPPSIHPKGPAYTWLTPLRYAEDLPEAPAWAVKMLQERWQAREAAPLVPQTARNGPSRIPIFGPALPWYHGEKVIRKANGEVDRSATLFALACRLAQSVATRETIAATLAERDVALGFHKYSGRRDASVRYLQLADLAIQQALADPRNQRHTRLIQPLQRSS